MHYIIYKITNKINGKIYIGQHMTDNLDDGYMGSGKRLWQAYKKHGIDNFKKEILFYCDSWEHMNNMEEYIVDEAFINRPDTYNICLGGNRGFLKMSDETKRKMSKSHKGKPKSKQMKERLSNTLKGHHVSDEVKQKISNTLKGRTHYQPPCSEETKRKISEANKGKKRSDEVKKKLSDAHKKRLSNQIYNGFQQGDDFRGEYTAHGDNPA